MKQGADDAWFYTREGEQIGPVSLSELRLKASEGTLHPRLDMAWKQGMNEWKPAGDIEGLFERKAVVEEVSVTPDPYKPPTHREPAEMLTQTGDWPGARRRTFYLMTILFPVVWNIGFATASAMLSSQVSPEILGVVASVAMLVIIVLSIFFGLQRLANVGMSRWWYLGNLVPILNFWVGYRMFVCPAGYAYHKKLDTIGVVLAILYWLMVALWLLAMVAIIAVIFGVAGDSEMQKRIEEAYQNTLRYNRANP